MAVANYGQKKYGIYVDLPNATSSTPYDQYTVANGTNISNNSISGNGMSDETSLDFQAPSLHLFAQTEENARKTASLPIQDRSTCSSDLDCQNECPSFLGGQCVDERDIAYEFEVIRQVCACFTKQPVEWRG